MVKDVRKPPQKNYTCNVLFNASRDQGQVIHLFSEEAKQLLHPVTGLRETVRSV
jgi:hypothetical protein